MQEVEALCNRVLMLRAGALAIDARLEELKQSNYLTLECSLTEENTKTLNELEGVDSISTIEASNEANEFSIYRISLKPDCDSKTVSTEVATKVIQQGGKLYRLLPEHRDLETLFRGVNEMRYQQEDKKCSLKFKLNRQFAE